MERHAALLLELWREACRHIEIGASLERIAPILRQRLPAAAILVRRIDLTRAGVETVAVEDERGRPGASPGWEDWRREAGPPRRPRRR